MWLQRITVQARGWAGTGEEIQQRDKDLLIPKGKPLEDAKSFTDQIASNGHTNVAQFIEASVYKEKSDKRRRTLFGSTVFIVLSIAVIVSIWQRNVAIENTTIAERQRKEAVQQKDQTLIAQSQLLMEHSREALKKEDYLTSILLTLNASKNIYGGKRPQINVLYELKTALNQSLPTAVIESDFCANTQFRQRQWRGLIVSEKLGLLGVHCTGVLSILDLKTFKKLYSIDNKEAMFDFEFRQKHKQLIVASSSGILVYDAFTGKKVEHHGQPRGFIETQYFPNSDILAARGNFWSPDD